MEIKLAATGNMNEQQRDAKIMLNYRPNGRRQLGRPWKRLLEGSETGVSSRTRAG